MNVTIHSAPGGWLKVRAETLQDLKDIFHRAGVPMPRTPSMLLLGPVQVFVDSQVQSLLLSAGAVKE